MSTPTIGSRVLRLIQRLPGAKTVTLEPGGTFTIGEQPAAGGWTDLFAGLGMGQIADQLVEQIDGHFGPHRFGSIKMVLREGSTDYAFTIYQDKIETIRYYDWQWWEEQKGASLSEMDEFSEWSSEPARQVIYCDGSSEGGVCGVGVFSEDFGINVSKRLSFSGSNNVAECEGMLAALQEATNRGLTGFTVFTDSQLVAFWITGEYEAKSATAREYTPKMRAALVDLNATVRWIPGAENKADTASRACLFDEGTTAKAPCNVPVTGKIAHINKTPMPTLKFGDFRSLKSGRDQFSRIKLPALQEAVGPEVVAAVEVAFEAEDLHAKCYRWCLRGLDTDKAIRKVKTDAEVSENARQARQNDYDDDIHALKDRMFDCV